VQIRQEGSHTASCAVTGRNPALSTRLLATMASNNGCSVEGYCVMPMVSLSFGGAADAPVQQDRQIRHIPRMRIKDFVICKRQGLDLKSAAGLPRTKGHHSP